MKRIKIKSLHFAGAAHHPTNLIAMERIRRLGFRDEVGE
jgi:hypothetical protein